jgi:peptide/nickel transport system substrate-binding protein
MQRARLAWAGLLLGTAIGAAPAVAAPFKCPHVGGDFVFAQSANVNGLDQMVSSAVSTRNIAMNIFETIITRDDTNRPSPELADSVTESPDHQSYTFKLRQGISFHNGKPMTSGDVVASFNRYKRISILRSLFDNVDHWDAPDAATFVVHLKQVQPTFLEQLSSFSVPVVIVPAEDENDPPQQLKIIGTGPFQLVDYVPGGYVKLKRFDGYTPNTNYQDRTGFGGYKQACFDTVTFRIVTEPGARLAGLQTGEVQGNEDVPPKSLPVLKNDKNITLIPIENWTILVGLPNLRVPPTDNVYFRKAVQAALNMDDIMDGATDGAYRLNVGFQYPTQPTYSDAGKETYNLHDPEKAKQYLQQAGYKGEPVVLLTNKDYPVLYNSALVMSEQLKAIGINAKLTILDWPSAIAMRQQPGSVWNYFFTGWGTEPSLGPIPTMQQMMPPNPAYFPKPGQEDPELGADFKDMNVLPTAEGRQAAFARMQQRILDQAFILPFGSATLIEAVRSNVKGFKAFRIPRVANVWFEN